MPLLSEAPVVVTGACGLVGRATVRALRDRGLPVVATDLGTPANRELAESMPRDSDIAWRWCDLTSLDQTRGLVKASAPRAVVHLAAVIPPACYARPAVAEAVNVGATEHVAQALAAHAPQARLLLASSVAAYGPRNPHRDLGLLTAETPLTPIDLYGRHKAAAEAVVRAAEVPWAILRLGGVMSVDLPSSDRDVEFFSSSLPGDGRIHTVDVRDVARAFAAAVDADVEGETLLIGGDESHRLLQRDIGADMTGAMGLDGMLTPLLPGDPDDDSAWFATDWMDTTRAQEALDFQRHSWPDMLREIEESAGWKRYLLRVLGPPLQPILARRTAYHGRGLEHADLWRVIDERWPGAV